ncbi:MAG: pyrimidine-nucleoside phosphorylase [Myxococcales bacterium]|nr:pyrimidine-nucleoside phosphorylase [Myxococcales bacterium]
MNMVELIRRKRDGGRLSPEELQAFVRGVSRAPSDGGVTDYQAAALLMAIYFRGLDGAELATLTDAMLHSGDVLDLSDIVGAKVDKHSTGGVGDKISLHLAPAVAACGVYVPMISGRGLGHTGGTLDKLEAIPGFDVNLDEARFRHTLRDAGLALIGQTERLAPADKRLYALRDVTGTVESIPLIAASIMSKKLAEGIDGLVLDVKVGSGAFMKTAERGRELAQTLVEIGKRAGKRVTAFLTDMNQPLGRWIGNAVEVQESLAVLNGQGEPDLVELTVELGGEMLLLGGAVKSHDEGRARIARSLADGTALARFLRCVELQGGKIPTTRWFPEEHQEVEAGAGYVQRIDAEAIGMAALRLGAGRTRKEDAVDHGAWVRVIAKVGERVEPGHPVALFSRPKDAGTAAEVHERLRTAFTLGATPPAPQPLILEVIR